MRCTQPMGFGKHNPLEIPVNTCKECHQTIPMEMEVYTHDGMFDEYPLHRFKIDGNWYREIVQASVWSSGPMLFLCYERSKDGMKFNTWTQEEIDSEN